MAKASNLANGSLFLKFLLLLSAPGRSLSKGERRDVTTQRSSSGISDRVTEELVDAVMTTALSSQAKGETSHFPKSKPYVWNRNRQAATDYLDDYCPQICVDDDNVISNVTSSMTRTVSSYETAETTVDKSLCRNMTCFPCDCDGACDFFSKRCCSKGLRTSPTEVSFVGCLLYGFLAIVRCPEDWTDGNSTARAECESDPQSYALSEPVTDLETGKTYRNRQCASCHNAKSLASWTRTARCEHFQHVYMATSVDEMVRLVSGNTECTIHYAPPQNVSVLKCPQTKFFTDVVGTCNVTGAWRDHDKQVEQACLEIEDLYYRVIGTLGMVYRNLFCAICNGEQPQLTECPLYSVEGGLSDTPKSYTRLPLSLLLGLVSRPPEKQKLTECQGSQWQHFNGVCHNLTCTAGKLLEAENSTCFTAVTEIRGLMYKLHISLVSDTGLVLNTSSNVSLDNLVREIKNKLTEKTQHNVFEYNLNITLDVVCNEHEGEITQIIITGDITASRELNRDVAEGFLVQNLVIDSWILGDLISTKKVTLNQKVDLTEHSNVTVTSGQTNVTVASADQPKWAENVAKELRTTGSRTVKIVNALTLKNASTPFSNSIPESLKIPMTPLLTCAYVRLAKGEYEFRESEGGKRRVFLVGEYIEAEVETLLHTRMEEDDFLSACVETLNALRYIHKLKPAPLWQHVLSWVAMPLSILCVFLTLVVYALLPALRTQPGLNVMGTCGSLLVAQVALLLAYSQAASGVWCQVLGVVVHEAWLSTFCWMTLCSMHMFRVFSAKTRHESNSLFWKTARNVVLSISLPALVVVVVVATSYVQSHGESVGYSSATCFLNSQLLVGTAMVLPLSVVVVVNFALFVLTARRIHEVTQLNPRADSKHDSRQHVLVCARLSLLTGIMWTLSLLAEGLDLDWLRGLSIVANGGQGALLFMSYVTTRRVWLLLGARLGRYSDVTSSTRSTNEKFSSNAGST